MKSKRAYGISSSVDMPFEPAIDRVKAAFKEQGFGTLTEIDVQRTLKEKLGEEMEPYVILGMCSPQLAHRAIQAEHEIGLLLPCNVIVHQCGGTVHVSAQDPAQIMEFVGNEALRPIGNEARARIEAAICSLSNGR